MTTYTAILDTQVDPDAPITSGLGYQFRDNPLAIAEQTTGAPINETVWHPYDASLVGDGNDGVFWDYSVDGAAATLESPTLADGYDYAIRMIDVSILSSTHPVKVEIYLATTAAWQQVAATSSHTAPNTGSGFLEVFNTRLVSRSWGAFWRQPFVDNAGSVLGSGDSSSSHVTAQKVSKLRVSNGGSVNFDAGKVALYRRRAIWIEF